MKKLILALALLSIPAALDAKPKGGPIIIKCNPVCSEYIKPW